MSDSKKEKGEVNTFILTIILLGVFPALGAVFYFGSFTMIRVDTVFNIAFLSGIIAFILHVPFLKKLNRYLGEIIGYSIFGWGLIITAIFMSGNYLIHSHPVIDTYSIEKATAHPEERELPFPVTVTFDLQNSKNVIVAPDVYNDFPGMLKFNGEAELKFEAVPKMAFMTTAMGIFGYRILLHKELH